MSDLAVVVKRRIRAPVERVYAAWVHPEQLRAWWGPADVECIGAEVDAREGGEIALGNRTPDGVEVWIRGVFQHVEAPRRLVFTWTLGGATHQERVTVRFDPADGETDLTVVHERITTEPSREGHRAGWIGCLDGLARHLGISSS